MDPGHFVRNGPGSGGGWASVARVRGAGILLLFVGLVLAAGGVFMGCGSFFAWNGRHPVAVAEVTPGTPVSRAVPVKEGKRYTLAIDVVFERDGLEEKDGMLVVPAKFPLRASIKSASGEGPEVVGWLDPYEPPTALFGHGADVEARRRPVNAPPPELVAQRIVGPYVSPANGEVTFAVDLGKDVIGTAKVQEIRAVIFDDAVPSSVRLPFFAAGVGAGLSAVAIVLLGVGFFRGRRRRKGMSGA